MLVGGTKAAARPETADAETSAPAAIAGHDQTAADPAAAVHAALVAKGAGERGSQLAVVKLEAAPPPGPKAAHSSEQATAVEVELSKASSPQSSRSASTTGTVEFVESGDVNTSGSSGGGSGAESGSKGSKERPSSRKLVHVASGSLLDVQSGGSSGAATSLPPGALSCRSCAAHDTQEALLHVSPTAFAALAAHLVQLTLSSCTCGHAQRALHGTVAQQRLTRCSGCCLLEFGVQSRCCHRPSSAPRRSCFLLPAPTRGTWRRCRDSTTPSASCSAPLRCA
jgi:hypothetical protein